MNSLFYPMGGGNVKTLFTLFCLNLYCYLLSLSMFDKIAFLMKDRALGFFLVFMGGIAWVSCFTVKKHL